MTDTPDTPDWASVADESESLLKLRSIPFAMKLFERRADMEAIPRIRRLGAIHTLDQVVGRSALRPRADARGRRDLVPQGECGSLVLVRRRHGAKL